MNRRQLLGVLSACAAGVLVEACTSRRGNTTPLPPTTTSSPTTTAPRPLSTARPEPTTTTTTTTAITTWSPGRPATYVAHGPAGAPKVALTFHFAGPPGVVTRLLDALVAHGVRATLFAIGHWITAHPDLTRRALADGHELGNHTRSHRPMLTLDRAAVHAEIAGGADELVPFLGGIGRWFRPSGTDVPNQVILDEAGRVGYPVSVGYDIDSTDYTDPGARRVVDIVTRALHPGAIVSLHFGHQDTIEALPAILDGIGTAGLQPVTVSTLLA
jgi:peptidoglycan/xylan/chitin deacetylase (PgdA/CDA1 family)